MRFNKKGSAGLGIVSGIIILVIGGIILAWLTGIFSLPEPIRMVQANDEVCQNTLSFSSDDIARFEIKLRNYGADGGLFVNLSSKDVLSKSRNGVDFNNTSQKNWFVASDSPQDFEFDILRNNNPDNISIQVTYGCNELLCQKKQFCCNYVSTSSRNYEFLNELPIC